MWGDSLVVPSSLSLPRAWVQSLVRELRSPQATQPEKKKKGDFPGGQDSTFTAGGVGCIPWCDPQKIKKDWVQLPI